MKIDIVRSKQLIWRWNKIAFITNYSKYYKQIGPQMRLIKIISESITREVIASWLYVANFKGGSSIFAV